MPDSEGAAPRFNCPADVLVDKEGTIKWQTATICGLGKSWGGR
jgi:hypothetical protein